ncbi:MAG: lipoprotein signal peptidase, partial [Bacteroidia bacterium]|nr:lipoprotein signal peptidase [Bacteroidia bacterium]
MNRLTLPLIIITLILILDQTFKIWVKTNMYLGESIPVFTDWFYLHFTENEGMAFGMKLGGKTGKLILSIFRIIAVIIMLVWLIKLAKKPHFDKWLAVCLALIIAGALGNILDSSFYGLIFSDSHYNQIATLFPPEGGYTGFLHGKVVDMLYFPIVDTQFPDWLPLLGGKPFKFFNAIFNIAAVAISTG